MTAVIARLLHWWDGFLDLQVYRVGARVWLDGGELYGPMPATELGIALPFTYPPPAALLFAPLALVPLPVAEVLMLLASLAALGTALWLVLARALPDLNRVAALTVTIAAVAAAQFLEPVRETFSFGQINLILMGVICADILVRRPAWPRGLLIGIVVGIKLVPAGFLLYFLLRRDWRAAATMVAATLATVAVGFAILPADSMEYWFHTVFSTDRIGGPFYAGNQSLKGAVLRFGLPDAVATALWLTLAAATVVLAAIWMRRLFTAGAPTVALLVNAAAILLVSPVSWSHHWVWAAPALLLAAAGVSTHSGRAGTRRWTLTVAGFAVLFALGPQWLLPHADQQELGWSWWQQLLGSSYVWATLAVLGAGALRYRSPTPCPSNATGPHTQAGGQTHTMTTAERT